jgi:hypothetical protein
LFTDQADLSKQAYEALSKMKNKQKGEQVQEELIQESFKKYDYGRKVFEEFELKDFKTKVTLESNIYSALLKDLGETQLEGVQKLIGDMLNNVRAIYEHVNIKPAGTIFGSVTLESSDDDIEVQSKKIVNDHFRKEYFNLTQEQLESKYRSSVEAMAYDLAIEENIEVDDALDHSYKAIIFESLLTKINFPLTAKGRVEDLIQSKEYGDFFQQEELTNLYDNFKEQTRDLSRIFAAVI